MKSGHSYDEEEIRLLTQGRLLTTRVEVISEAHLTCVHLSREVRPRRPTQDVCAAAKRIFPIVGLRLYATADGIRQGLCGLRA